MRWFRTNLPAAMTVIAIQLTITATAYAECERLAPFCERFFAHDVVFDGSIISSERVMRDGQSLEMRDSGAVFVTKPMPHRVYTFIVNRAWRGVTTERVQIVEPESNLLQGRYIVVGHRNPDGTVTAIWCGATKRYDDAGEELAYLESLGEPATGGRVFGRVFVRDALHQDAKDDFVNVVTPVTLTGNGVNRTVSSTGGRFEFDGLEAGIYTIALRAPPATEGYNGPFPIRVFDRHACAEAEVWLEPTGSIAVDVLESNGTPARSAVLHLMSADAWQSPAAVVRDAFTGDGTFLFEGVSPGRYVLIARVIDNRIGAVPSSTLNVWLGPSPRGDSTIVVPADGHVRLPTLALPVREPEATTELELQWSDGFPVSRSYVRVVDVSDTFLPARFRTSYPNITDAAGRTRFSLVPGRAYSIQVETERGRPGTSTQTPVGMSEPFIASDGKQTRPLVLRIP